MPPSVVPTPDTTAIQNRVFAAFVMICFEYVGTFTPARPAIGRVDRVIGKVPLVET